MSGSWTGDRYELDEDLGPVLALVDRLTSWTFELALLAYNCSSQVAMAAVIGVISTRAPQGLPMVVLGTVLHTAATTVVCVDLATSDSSTAALALLFLAPHLVILFVAPTWFAADWLHRRLHQGSPAT